MSSSFRNSAAALALIFFAAGCSTAENTQTNISEKPVIEVVQLDSAVDEQKGESVLMLAQVNQLTDEVRTLRDRVEVLEFELERARQRQIELYEDLDRRVREFERRAQPVPDTQPATETTTETQPGSTEEVVTEPEQADTQPAQEQPATEPAVIVDPQVVQEAYESAFRTIRKGRYEDAILEFNALIESYPSSDLVDDSLYWIAEANYAMQKFDEALPAYERVIRDYPNIRRAPEALLKIGYIYYQKADYAESQLYLLDVIDKYPASRSALSARRRLDKMERDGVL